MSKRSKGIKIDENLKAQKNPIIRESPTLYNLQPKWSAVRTTYSTFQLLL